MNSYPEQDHLAAYEQERQPERCAHVLLVDDDMLTVKALSDFLSEHHYRVTVAGSGQECLDIAESANPDIILLDIIMPDLDGLETCRRLNDNQQTMDIPIIFLTALDGQTSTLLGFAAGGVDYVTKPVQESVLLARLHTHITLKRLREELQVKNRKLQEKIREHQSTQEKIASQNAFLQTVVNSFPHPFYVIDARNYTILLTNSVAEKAGISCGKTCYSVTHKSDKPCENEHRCPLKEVIYSKRPVILEHLHRYDDGSAKNVEVHGYPILDNNGSVIQMIECSVDITEQKTMEAEREGLVKQLMEALDHVKLLSGILPICAYCKEIRDDRGYWNKLEKFISEHSEAEFSHGICPKCMKKNFPDVELHE